MDVKEIVKEMLKQGMSKEEIVQNLSDLGVENAEEILAEASKGAGGQQPAASPSRDIPRLEITRVSGDEEKPTDLEQMLASQGIGERESAKAPSGGDYSKLQREVSSLSAEVKALADVCKKILETNRSILAKLD